MICFRALGGPVCCLPTDVEVLRRGEVVVAGVSHCLFFSRVKLFRRFILAVRFRFHCDRTFVLAVGLVRFGSVLSAFRRVPSFVGRPELARFRRLFNLLRASLLLPLVAAYAKIVKDPFSDGVPFVVPGARPSDSSADAASVALRGVAVYVDL